MTGDVERDQTLQHPRCVLNVLKRHFARYTPEMVERICGISQEQFHEVAELLIANSGRERTSALCYAVGWTQHTAGAQMIRAGAILQLLLGNIGRPGGGVLALRGHASIQGSTDIPTLYDLLPGYLHMPHAREGELDLETLLRQPAARRGGWWSNFPKYAVSLLKAWFGDAATAENDYGFEHLPKITGNHSHFPTMLRALDGGLDGMFLMGQNPAVGSMHAGLQRRALANVKWVVVRDLVEVESATFWRDSPEVRVRRAEDRGHPDRGLPDARREPRREGGHVHEHAAADPVPRQGARAARRRPLGAVVHAPPVQARPARTTRARPPSATGRS